MTHKERRTAFEALIAQGIWVLMLLALGKRPMDAVTDYRCHALAYFDLHGNQGPQAKEYRRERAFPWLP